MLKPRGTITYKSKMEKRFGVTLKQGYVDRVTTMLMIPPGNSDILHRLILRKTRSCEEIQKWKNQTGIAIVNSAARS